MSTQLSTVTPGSILARWILAGALGFGTGIAGGVGLTLTVGKLPGVNEDRFLGYAALFCLGLAVGFTQWRAMAGFLPGPAGWIIATLVGHLLALIPFAIPGLPALPGPELSDDALLLACIGACVGLAQWSVLREHYRRAAVWVPASTVGFLTFLWLVANPAHTLTEFIVVGAVLGGLAGVVPGAVLAWLVHQPRAATAS